MLVNCNYCKVEINRKKSNCGTKNFCSRKCYSLFNKGKDTWNKGKKGLVKMSNETKLKMSIIRLKRKKEKGFINSLESIEKMRIKAIGRKHSQTTKEKIKVIMKYRKQKRCEKCGCLLGRLKHICPDKVWNKGLRFSSTPQIYSNDWVETLRESIRQRDKYICKICGLKQSELKGWHKRLSVHHIDYNKFNCNPTNLISLCNSCHTKTNYKRETWKEYFKKLCLLK